MLSLKVCGYFIIVTERKNLFFFKEENALSQLFKIGFRSPTVETLVNLLFCCFSYCILMNNKGFGVIDHLN